MHEQQLQKIIGHQFKHPELLQEARTHPSLAHEHASGKMADNQRLEFWGMLSSN